jgi:hypothetical protein
MLLVRRDYLAQRSKVYPAMALINEPIIIPILAYSK